MAAKQIGSGGFYCWSCGARVKNGEKNCPRCGARYTGEKRYGKTSAVGAGGVGWSDKANDPFFRKYAGKYILLSVGWMVGLSILIPGLLLYSGQVAPRGEGIAVLIAVPAVIWVLGLITLVKKFGGRDKSWEGVVEDKTRGYETRREDGAAKSARSAPYVGYVVTFRRLDGSVKRLINKDDSTLFDHLQLGDRVRNHDRRFIKYLEKYDKSRDIELFCAACGSLNDARDNYCERCGAPMLKGEPCAPAGEVPPAPAPAPETPAFCKYCGARLTGGAFCENCGAKVASDTARR